MNAAKSQHTAEATYKTREKREKREREEIKRMCAKGWEQQGKRQNECTLI